MIKAGDTFVWCGNAKKEHLYIALNDAAKCEGKVVVANLTDSTGGPASFVLRKGDHPYLQKPSDVNFGDSFVAKEELIERAITSFSAVPNKVMDLALVEKIAKRAITHPACSKDVINILKAAWT